MAAAAAVGAVVLGVLASARVMSRAQAGWTLPVVALGAGAARLWALTDRFGALAFVAVVVSALVFAARVAPPPWPSRLLAHVRPRPVRLVVDALAAFTIVCAVAATFVGGSGGSDFAVVTAAALEASVVVAVFAVRMWRFAPRRRQVDVTLLMAIAVLGVIVVPELAPLAGTVGALVAAAVSRVAPVSRLGA
jgi:hypothetical protein